ncbi:hypothetical protein NMG60_11003293 [Bertholletia excelsa]
MWEDQARMNHHNSFNEVTRQRTLRRQSTFLRVHVSNPLVRNHLRIWVVGVHIDIMQHLYPYFFDVKSS